MVYGFVYLNMEWLLHVYPKTVGTAAWEATQQLSDFSIFFEYCKAASAAERLQHESSGKMC